MIFKTLNQQVRNAFSNSATHYEVLASMQYEIGRELIQTIKPRNEDCFMLDVGMGTGKLTNRLSLTFPEAQVIGLDFADGMVAQAQKSYETFKVIQADANNLPLADQSMDVVISNLAYQWVTPLPSALAQVYRVLKPQGQFCATLFGHETLHELFSALEKSNPRRNMTPLQRLPRREIVEDSLRQVGFKNIEVKTEITKTHFESMKDLLKWVKAIGANALNRNVFIGPKLLDQAATYYEENFSERWGVTASFEVIWVKGYHASE